MTTQEDLRLLLKQAPIDEWSTREKLALATSVHKSGDQNWSSVSRLLKTFAEKNRPADWFSQKFCALQYNDMLEKVEIPKRKRGERGEVTAQDLIVKQLTLERLDELKNSIEKNLLEFDFINKSLEKLKDEKCDESFLDEMRSYIREEDKKDKESKAKNDLWLKERNFKILQMKSRPLMYSKQVKTPVIVTPAVEDKNKTPLIIKAVSEKENTDTTVTEPNTKSSNVNFTSPSLLSTMLQNSSNDTSIKDDPTKNVEKPEEKQNIAENTKETTNKKDEPTNFDSKIEIEDNKIESKVTIDENPTIIANEEMEENNAVDNVNNEVILEQENSNDTIEDTVSDIEAAHTTSSVADKNLNSKEDVTVDLTVSNSETNKSTSPVKENIKDEPDLTLEISTTILDTTKDSSICTTTLNEESSYSAEDRIIRKAKRRRSNLNNSSSNIIQTRSTRSQSQVKTEEPKESVIKENSKIYPKNRSISIEETSVDNSISEESNDVKVSTNINESNQNDEIVDFKFQKLALAVLQTIGNNANASLFFGPISGNEAEDYKRIIRREMDLNLIRKRIENKEIKTVVEFKRDLLLMFSNVMMFYDSDFYKPVLEIQKEVLELMEPPESKMRTREKVTTPQEVKSTRRKTRGSISIENESSVVKNKHTSKKN